MKKPLLIGVSTLTLLAVSATLFAQTTTGSSLITEMKAAVRSFTLAGELNPGATGLQSAPLVGKRTGDQLSAAEYNRLLELVSQGGGGSGGSGWVDVPLTDTADFDGKCDYIFNGLRATFVHPEIIGFVKNEFDATSAASWYAVRKANKNTMINHQDNYANNTIYPNQPITSITKNCGGGGGTGGGAFSVMDLDCTTINVAGGAAVTATCPADRKVISGGCSGFVPAANSVPATNGWYCSNTSNFGGGIAYAVCCK